MTNQDIVDTWFAHKHLRRTKGRREDTLFLMPFFIMDTCYQIYCKDIKDLPCKHLMKQAKKRWADCYHKYTMDFFRAFNSEQVDFIVDQMDVFNDYIHNQVVILKSMVMSKIPDTTSFEGKKVLASLMLCNVLAQAAQSLHSNMYRHSDMSKIINPHIEGVKKASYDIAYHSPASSGVALAESDEVMKLIDALCKKIMEFLTEQKHEN